MNLKKEETLIAYDAIAEDYAKYSEGKFNYLDAIEKLVLKFSLKKGSILDIGSGDGRRIIKINKFLESNKCILVEPSKEMAKISRKNHDFEVFECFGENIDELNLPKFDNIYALWNVLGHVNSYENRIKMLKNIKDLLSPHGFFMMDVNNRHNSNAYGFSRVMIRRIIDMFFFNEARGDAKYDWVINNKTYKGFGHLFTPNEIEKLIELAGLKIKKRLTVDYKTGKVSNSPLKGQLFYVLTI